MIKPDWTMEKRAAAGFFFFVMGLERKRVMVFSYDTIVKEETGLRIGWMGSSRPRDKASF